METASPANSARQFSSPSLERSASSTPRSRVKTVKWEISSADDGDGEGLDQVVQLIETASGPVDPDSAPIDDSLKHVVETQFHHFDQQQNVEALREDLENRFHEVEERFNRRWLVLDFDEPEIEEEFRCETYDNHKAYMYAVVGTFCIYLIFAALFFNVAPLVRLSGEPMPNISCFMGLNMSYPVVELIDGSNATITAREHLDRAYLRGDAPSYSAEWAAQLLQVALLLRSLSILNVLMVVAALKCASRKVALGTVVACFFFACILNDLAFCYESIVVAVIDEAILVPQPNPALPPLLFLMLVYTVGIPGIPFTTACMCGWGVIVTSLISHFMVWNGDNLLGQHRLAGIVWGGVDLSAGMDALDPIGALGKQLMRVLLFNIFGTFGTRCTRARCTLAVDAVHAGGEGGEHGRRATERAALSAEAAAAGISAAHAALHAPLPHREAKQEQHACDTRAAAAPSLHSLTLGCSLVSRALPSPAPLAKLASSKRGRCASTSCTCGCCTRRCSCTMHAGCASTSSPPTRCPLPSCARSQTASGISSKSTSTAPCCKPTW